jgi:SAM-dependent methyltransferase
VGRTSPTTAYWNRIARESAAARPQRTWRDYCDQINIGLLRRLLPAGAGRLLLKTDLFDEASISGGLALELVRHAGRVVGVDLAPVTARAARARHAGVAVLVADVRRLPFRDRSFDRIVSNSTLDHFATLDQLAASLIELRRVLRDGGCLVLTLDNLRNPLVALRNALPDRLRRGLGLVPYYVGATCGPGRLRRLMVRAGFEVQAVETVMHCPRFLAVAIAGWIERSARSETRRRFIAHLMGWERLGRWPTRSLTGHFIALSAVPAPPARP